MGGGKTPHLGGAGADLSHSWDAIRPPPEGTQREDMSVDDRSWLAGRFEENRTHLRSVAYRMLGSLSEADDAVQEAWLRLSRSDAGGIGNLTGWLTTVVARL